MDQLHEKYENLKVYLKSLGSVAVAFSSGVDSTFLLKVAHDVLGDKAIAVTAASCSFPERELNEAKKFCAENGIQHIVCESEELDIDGFRQNPKNRCYLCKHELFEKVWNIAKESGLNAVAEGSNMDDNGDYRPGLVAVKELGVSSPLRAAELNKQEIRELSKELGLSTWNKQSFACLSSRFVYGETIKKKSLVWWRKLNSSCLIWDSIKCVIESMTKWQESKFCRQEFEKLLAEGIREKVYNYFKELGFTYVTLDLGGYRTGSMNETLH